MMLSYILASVERKLLHTSSHEMCLYSVVFVFLSLFFLFSICQALFYCALIYFSFGLSKLWWTPTVRGWVLSKHDLLYKLHGPAMTLILLFCHTYGWLKYLGGAVLMACIWSLGGDMIDYFGKWDFDTLHALVTLNMHHHGGIIAFYFQQPQDALLNSLLFGHFWWIHSYHGWGITEAITNGWEKITGYKCTKFSEGYACFTVLFSAIYCYYMPVGFTYQTCAIISMCGGRYLIFDNYLNFTFMGKIEAPGVIFSFTCKALGWIPAILVLAAYMVYYGWKKAQIGENMVKPPRCVITDKIHNFLDSFPRQEKNEEAIKEGIALLETSFKKGEFPVFRAVIESDQVKLKDLLDSGSDPNQKESKFQSSPIAWAARLCHIDSACVLLEAGANPFVKGVRKYARQHDQTHFLKFLDELTPLVWEALREETGIQYERQKQAGLTWNMAKELAKSKGGRLCTEAEAEKYLMGAPLIVDETQLCAITDENGKQKWIQVGNKFFKTGHIIENDSDPYFWGNNLEALENVHYQWNKVLLWTDSAGGGMIPNDSETEPQTRGIESGA